MRQTITEWQTTTYRLSVHGQIEPHSGNLALAQERFLCGSPPHQHTGIPALTMDNEADAEGTLHLPGEYCQLSINHPAYPTPLLWVCTKMECLMEVIARWSIPTNIRRLYTIPSRFAGGSYPLLMYTIPPRSEPNFLSQLSWETFAHIQNQNVSINFQVFPQMRCSECQLLGTHGYTIPQPECGVCYDRPAYHHTRCCPSNLQVPNPISPTESSEEPSQGY